MISSVAKIVPVEPFAVGLTWPQAPRWHDGRLLVADVHGARVVAYDQQGRENVLFQRPLDANPPFTPCGLLPDGDDVLIVSMVDNAIFSLRSAAPVVSFASVSSSHPTDLVRTPSGHMIVTQIGFDIWAGEEWRPSPLLRVGSDGAVDEASEAGSFLITSGIGLSPDGNTLIVAVVGENCLRAFDVTDTGRLVNGRVHAELPVHGMCVDAEGGVWVAQTSTGACVRVSPDGKSITHEARLPPGTGMPVACTLGGPDGRTLFITAGTESQDAGKSRAGKEGRLFRAAVDVPGALVWPAGQGEGEVP